MKFLLTRPLPDSRILADQLRAAGHDVVLCPMLEIVERQETVDLGGVQALLLTSANGARALAAASTRRDLPAFAVGAATGAALREAGFADVRVAGGDVAALAERVRRDCAPSAGAVLHVAGSAVAGDLAGDLGQAGFEVRRVVLYDAVPAQRLDPALFEQRFDVALFFSPRTAAAFATLAQQGGLADHCAMAEAWCLSAPVADAAGALPWRAVRVASQPDQTHLLALQELYTPMSDTPMPEAPKSEAPKSEAPKSEAPFAASPPPPSAGRAVGRWLARLLFVVALATLAGFVWIRYGGQIWHGTALDRRLTAVETSVTALGGRIDQVEDSLSALRRQALDADRQLGDLRAEAALAVNDRAAGPTNAQLDSKTSALAAQLQAQEARLAGLEQSVATGRVGLPAVLALARLRDAIELGQPFAQPLGQFSDIAAQMGAAGRALQGDIAALRTISDGVATRAQLRAGLKAAADAADEAARTAPDANWVQRVLGEFRHLVVIRRVSDEASDAPETIFTRAEAALDRDELDTAFAEIAKLQGRAAEAAAVWRGQAEARLAADDAVTRLEAGVTAALASDRSPADSAQSNRPGTAVRP